MNVKARGGYEYYVTFIDDYLRYGYVYLMQRKSEIFDKFKEFRAEVENQLGKTIKTLRSDRGGEYLDQEFLRLHGRVWDSVPTHSSWYTSAEWCRGEEK